LLIPAGEPDVVEPHGRQREGRAVFSLRSRIVQASGVLAAPADGELLLIREETNACYALRGSGVDVWDAARRPVRVGDICDALVGIYAVDRSTCESQVLRTVEELVGQGLFVCAS
jgi:hypothetical protein